MTMHGRQQWMFRLGMVIALLTLTLFAATWSKHPLPPRGLLAIVAAMLLAGIPALILGVQHTLALARQERTRR